MLARRMLVLMGASLFAVALTGCGRGKDSGPSSGENLHGTWVGAVDGEPVTLTFGPNNAVKALVEDEVGEGTYTVDWSKKPAHLDIDWGPRGKVQTIIELTNDNLKVEDAKRGAERPTVFSDRARVLKRAVGNAPTSPSQVRSLDPKLRTELQAAHEEGMAVYRSAGRLREEISIRTEIKMLGMDRYVAELKKALQSMMLPENLDNAAIMEKLKECDGLIARLRKARDNYQTASAKVGDLNSLSQRDQRWVQDQGAELNVSLDSLTERRRDLSQLHESGAGPGAGEAKEPKKK